MNRPLTWLERLVDEACGFNQANDKPAPGKVPDGKIKLVCPVCKKVCLIPSGPTLNNVPSTLAYECPDHRKRRVVKGERKKNV